MKRYFILTAEKVDDLERAVNDDLEADLRREPVGAPFFIEEFSVWGQVIFLRGAK